jgi:hypothetical protein
LFMSLARRALVSFVIVIVGLSTASAQKATRKPKPTAAPVAAAPTEPGPAQIEFSKTQFTLSNNFLSATWRVYGNGVVGAEFRDRVTNRVLPGQAAPFVLLMKDGRVLSASSMRVVGGPRPVMLQGRAESPRQGERVDGKAVSVELEDANGTLHATWRAVLRDGANYVRQELTVECKSGDLPVTEIRLIDWNLKDAAVVGTVKGSPVAAGNIFAAFEHPLSACAVAAGRARCKLSRELPLKAGQALHYSSVVGVTQTGQLRRGFATYLERERAHPYRAFLHYNSWYDLGYFSKYDEPGALEVVRQFSSELAQKRGVVISSFLFDDGWDDPATLWKFNSGFPKGFGAVRKSAETIGAAPGVWLSPWGGYGKPRQQRIAVGTKAGLEVVDNGFALSGPKYFNLFREACLRMVRDYGVNQFKFDGMGNANRVVAGSYFDSDFDAAINLITELRSQNPDLFVNLTTGTYPSPFWLQSADSIWRGGEDHDFLGVGTARQRWITYRDADTYEHVVLDGPLFPLNSVMLHGLIYAKSAKGLESDAAGDFRSEVRSYFGSGTQLQEMYITPSLLSSANWDDLAEAAKWSRANADVLADSHWIGGDPAQLEVYGWASWNARKGILVLRNPSDREQEIEVDVANAFEVPATAAKSYRLQSPWKQDASIAPMTAKAGTPVKFRLKAYEVAVFEATPITK